MRKAISRVATLILTLRCWTRVKIDKEEQMSQYRCRRRRLCRRNPLEQGCGGEADTVRVALICFGERDVHADGSRPL